ncbi:hypothetical protein [Arthrobacter sp. OAP107]|uniref:hypothetical protein n=1 Tax=Arthrobacter sp. OAP107 TaxID=3156445 RepID=UPI003396D6F4
MEMQPQGDKRAAATIPDEWHDALAQRVDEHSRIATARRFLECGVTVEQVRAALMDGGDALFAAAHVGPEQWGEVSNGAVAVALLSAEISALMAHLNSRASGIRSVAVAELLEEYSAVSVAETLGVSRQKVYEIARAGLRLPYLDKVPWRPL